MTDPTTRLRVYVKVISAEHFDERLFFRELEALVTLNHPCICRIVGWAPPIGDHNAEIHMDLAGNRSLASVLQRVGWGERPAFWTPTGKAVIICGIALGMTYVHSKGYIHGDLKPSSILIDGRGEALISDFGSVRHEGEDTGFAPVSCNPRYAAPECFIETAQGKDKADVFSFGSIVYEILTEQAVFPVSMSPFDIIRTFGSGRMPEIPDFCGAFARKLIHDCWSQDPQCRPAFHQIIERFQDADFKIIPGASHSLTSRYVRAILEESP